jgi:hypothetical protein
MTAGAANQFRAEFAYHYITRQKAAKVWIDAVAAHTPVKFVQQ